MLHISQKIADFRIIAQNSVAKFGFLCYNLNCGLLLLGGKLIYFIKLQISRTKGEENET